MMVASRQAQSSTAAGQLFRNGTTPRLGKSKGYLPLKTESIPGPFDAKTMRNDTLSSKTTHLNPGEQAIKKGDSSEAVSTKVRKRTETLPGGRFPMPDKKHARLALQMLGKAKNLSAKDKKKIKVRAHGMLGSKKESAAVTGGSLRETLVFNPRLLEGSYDEATRTADVIIIEEGLGNRRDKHYYSADTLIKAVAQKVFDGAQAYADHPSQFEETDRPERSVRDLFGYYFDTRVVQRNGKTAIAAKLKIQDGQDWAVGLIKEAIAYNAKFPDKVYAGISINADGDVSPKDVGGQSVNNVNSITDAFSADLVTKPARGGRFLALVESDKGATMDKKLVEAAARLKAQIKEGSVDPEDLNFLLESVTDDAEKSVKSGAMESKKDCAEDMEEGAAFGGKKAPPFTSKDGKGQPNDQTDNDPQDDEDDDNEDDEVSESKSKESKTRESAAFAAALKEARAEAASEVAALKKKLKDAQTAQAMRESLEMAKTKLKESSLPAAAATKLLPTLVGKSDAEMDSLIETESNYVSEIGGRRIEGNPDRTVRVRESDYRANEAAIFAGMGA
jgi:hypothetical protein